MYFSFPELVSYFYVVYFIIRCTLSVEFMFLSFQILGSGLDVLSKEFFSSFAILRRHPSRRTSSVHFFFHLCPSSSRACGVLSLRNIKPVHVSRSLLHYGAPLSHEESQYVSHDFLTDLVPVIGFLAFSLFLSLAPPPVAPGFSPLARGSSLTRCVVGWGRACRLRAARSRLPVLPRRAPVLLVILPRLISDPRAIHSFVVVRLSVHLPSFICSPFHLSSFHFITTKLSEENKF